MLTCLRSVVLYYCDPLRGRGSVLRFRTFVDGRSTDISTGKKNSGTTEVPSFTIAEYAGMHFVYGFLRYKLCYVTEGIKRRYSDQRRRCRRVFETVHSNLIRTGTVKPRTRADRRRPGTHVGYRAQKHISQALGTRCATGRFFQSSTWRRRTVRDIQTFPFHVQAVGRLQPGQACPAAVLSKVVAQECGYLPVSVLCFVDWCCSTCKKWCTQSAQLACVGNGESSHTFSVSVWAVIVGDSVIGLQVMQERLGGVRNADNIEETLSLVSENVPVHTQESLWSQHVGASPHFAHRVYSYLSDNFTDRWIGRGGPILWPPRSHDMTSLDFYLWVSMKKNVCATKFRDSGDPVYQIDGTAVDIAPRQLVSGRDWTSLWVVCFGGGRALWISVVVIHKKFTAVTSSQHTNRKVLKNMYSK